MQQGRPWILALLVLTGACSSNDHTAPTSAPTTAISATSTGDTGSTMSADPTKACTVLSPTDFKAVGFTVDDEGEDVSQNFNLSTTTSVACQWTNLDSNQGGSWELVIGMGDAEPAFASDLSLAEIDTVTKLSIGDDAYLVDKVSSFDNADHDFEAGVRIGDIYFTMSTTDDRGGDAISTLAKLIADRLTKS